MPLVLTCAVRAAAMHGMSEFPGLKTVTELEEEIIMIFQYQAITSMITDSILS